MWRNIVRKHGSLLNSNLTKKTPQQTYLMLIKEAKQCFKNKNYTEAIDRQKRRYLYNVRPLMLITCWRKLMQI